LGNSIATCVVAGSYCKQTVGKTYRGSIPIALSHFHIYSFIGKSLFYILVTITIWRYFMQTIMVIISIYQYDF